MAFTTRPELRGDFGMVASTHWLASGVGEGSPQCGHASTIRSGPRLMAGRERA